MPSYTKQPNLPGGTEASPPCPEGDPRVPSAARSDWNPRTETGDTPELSDPSAQYRAVSKKSLLWKGSVKAVFGPGRHSPHCQCACCSMGVGDASRWSSLMFSLFQVW